MDQSYSDNRSDMMVMSIGPLDILPRSVRRSDDFGIHCNTIYNHGQNKIWADICYDQLTI